MQRQTKGQFQMKTRGDTAGAYSAHGRSVFRCDGAEFGSWEVVDSAWARGELLPLWNHFLDGVACERRAEALGFEPEDGALQYLSEEYRYEADLVSAEETEKWLADRELTEAEFAAYFTRQYWLNHFDGAVPEEFERPAYPSSTGEFRNLLLGDLVLSRQFDHLARSASWRSAAHAFGRENQVLPDAEKALLALLSDRDLDLHSALEQAGWLGRDREWLGHCAVMEAAFELERGKPLTESNRARALATRRLGLTCVDLETAFVPNENAAREFVHCLREGGDVAAELAHDCGFEFQRTTIFVEDCSPEMQSALLSASPEEVLAPREAGDRFAVCRLARKTDPSLDNLQVLERIDVRLIEGHFTQLATGRVHWVHRPL
jgi:hypothetical protein